MNGQPEQRPRGRERLHLVAIAAAVIVAASLPTTIGYLLTWSVTVGAGAASAFALVSLRVRVRHFEADNLTEFILQSRLEFP